MPIDVQETQGDLGHFTIKYGGGHSKIWYLPDHMTVAWTEEVQKAQNEMGEVSGLLAEVLADWEILRNGKKIPIERDEIVALPIGLFGAIAKGCIEEAMKRGRVVNRQERKKAGGFLEGLFRDLGGKPDEPDDTTDDGGGEG